MAFAQGTSESVLIGLESSYNTLPGSVTAEKIPVTNPSIQPGRNKFTAQALTGVPEPRPVVFGKVGDDGDLGIECNPASLCTGLRGLYTAPVVGGTAALYNLQYVFGAQSYHFIEERHSDITQFVLYNGVLFHGANFQFGAEGLMESRFRVMASGKQTYSGSTAVNSTITDRTGYDPFSYLLCRIKQGGNVIGYSQSVELNVDRKPGNAVAQDQSTYRAAVFTEIPEVSGKMTALFQDAVLANIAMSGTETSLEIWVPTLGNGYAILCEMPTVRFRPPQKRTQGTGIVQIELEFDVYGKAGTSKIAGKTWGQYLAVAGFPALNTLTLVISPDGGGNQTFTMTASENTPDAVVTKINATATGFLASVDRASGDTGGVLRLQSTTTGSASSVRVQSSSTAAVSLGFDTNVTHTGYDGKSMLWTIFSPLNT
jgi:hypothetical protein